MADEPTRVSNLTLAVNERALTKLVLELVTDYERTYGRMPTLAWLLKQLGER